MWKYGQDRSYYTFIARLIVPILLSTHIAAYDPPGGLRAVLRGSIFAGMFQPEGTVMLTTQPGFPYTFVVDPDQ